MLIFYIIIDFKQINSYSLTNITRDIRLNVGIVGENVMKKGLILPCRSLIQLKNLLIILKITQQFLDDKLSIL